MGPVPEASKSSSSVPARRPGWFRGLPMWARIAIPAVLALGVAAVLLLATLPPSAPADPVGATRSACQSGIRAEVESHDVEVIEVSFFGVESTGDDAYLARGETAYRDADGAVQRVQVRCTVRFEVGAMRAPSIRFSEPITAG